MYICIISNNYAINTFSFLERFSPSPPTEVSTPPVSVPSSSVEAPTSPQPTMAPSPSPVSSLTPSPTEPATPPPTGEPHNLYYVYTCICMYIHVICKPWFIGVFNIYIYHLRSRSEEAQQTSNDRD